MNDFESRFSFIKDDILRQNLAQGFQHVTELVLLTKMKHPISINKSFLRKTTIVWSAAIVESMMFYLLQEKNLWENFSEKWQPSSPNRIHITPEGEEFIWCKRKKITLNKRTNFGEMVDVCEKAKIFTKSECNNIKKLIKSRNQIHLHTLTTVGTGISEKLLDEKFEIVRMATNQIKTQFI